MISPFLARLLADLHAPQTAGFAGTLDAQGLPTGSGASASPVSAGQYMHQLLGPQNPQPTSPQAIQQMAGNDPNLMAQKFGQLGQQGSVGLSSLLGGGSLLALLLAGHVIRNELHKQPDLLQQLPSLLAPRPGAIKSGVQELKSQL